MVLILNFKDDFNFNLTMHALYNVSYKLLMSIN